MESLLDAIGDSWRISTEASSSISAPHPRFSCYKYKFSASSQEERRRQFIEAQKQKRYDLVYHARCLAEGRWEAGCSIDEDMEISYMYTGPEKSFKNQLMLSEWLVDVPKDMEENWIVVPCPIGKRCLVVASKGRTKAYARNGYKVASFPSVLPGGCRDFNEKFKDYCLLDCIQSFMSTTFYVLDIMCWKSHPVFDSEAEFRFYWLEAKLAEVPEIGETSEQNRYKFAPLKRHPFTRESMKKTLSSPLSFPDKLDGLLFYDKRAHYQPGAVSPLVGWLKAYMVPEILGIAVDQTYIKDKPSSYTSLKDKLARNRQEEEKKKLKEKAMQNGRRGEMVEQMEEDYMARCAMAGTLLWL